VLRGQLGQLVLLALQAIQVQWVLQAQLVHKAFRANRVSRVISVLQAQLVHKAFRAMSGLQAQQGQLVLLVLLAQTQQYRAQQAPQVQLALPVLQAHKEV